MARRPSPRRRLRAWRCWSGMTEAELAERIRRLAAYLGQPDPGVTAALVAEWEEVGTLVAPARLSLWCAALGVPVAECVALVDPLQLPQADPPLPAALAAGSVGPGGDDDMQRRNFFRVLAGFGALMFDPERLEGALGDRAHIDLSLVSSLGASVRGLAGFWDRLPPPVLRRALLTHLETVRSLLAGPLPPHLRRELMAVGGHAAALAGATARAMGHEDEARSHLLMAGQLSGGAGHTGMQALALIWSADSLSGTQRGIGAVPEQADILAMLERAEALAEGSPWAVRAYVFLRQAEERAAAGEATEAARLLDQADTVWEGRAADDGTMYGRPVFAGTKHLAFRGHVETLSGRPAEAAAILQATLDGLRSEAVSDRASILADLAAAHARLGDVDAACELLGRAWAVAGEHGLEDRRQRVLGVRRRDLGRWDGEPAVRRLDEVIAGS